MRDDFPPSEERLDELRAVGDAVVDDFVVDHFKKESVRGLMHSLAGERPIAKDTWAQLALDEDELEKQALDTLLEQLTENLPELDERDEAAAQKLFDDYGPEILMILGFYSLPAAYSAENGVQVLAQTRYLELEPDRRLAETSQIIIDVMSKGLGEGQEGREAALRTRLIHGAIRVLIIDNQDFDMTTFGVPINQEDMAATLMTFSYLVIDGLTSMGIRVSEEDAEAYIDTWRQVGRLLGVADELLPDTFAEAEALTLLIQDRQIRASSEGIELLKILLCTLEEKTLRGLPSSMMRMFLPRRTANEMKVPRRFFPIPDIAVHQLVRTFGFIDSVLLARLPLRSLILRDVSMGLLFHVMNWQDGDLGAKPEFDIPESLTWWSPDEMPRRNVPQVLLDTALAGPRGGTVAKRQRNQAREERKAQKGA